jgi:small GTP-binding protein
MDKKKKQICTALLAHVDAGKTTLSESLLYLCGAIRTFGRVDNKDAFFDTDELERSRGITIFSKQAQLQMNDTSVTLLDTPGHVDFSAEMERTLQVLDYAILLVSAADGVQGHTMTLWRLLEKYDIPTFVFVNKMDQPQADADRLMAQLKERLSDGCVAFVEEKGESFYEEAAMCGEEALEYFLENGEIPDEMLIRLIAQRKLFPCYFGSALKQTGIQEFIDGFSVYTKMRTYPEKFGAKVYKITRDEQGRRLTHVKITGGSLKVRDMLEANPPKDWKEKVNEIRIYSGEKYEMADEVEAGSICALAGLSKTAAGDGLGIEADSPIPVLEPVLNYSLILPDGLDAVSALKKLSQLEEEEPLLHIVWNEQLQEIQAQLMGEVQTEILKSLIEKRFGWQIEFGGGSIVYKETIASTVEGVGHFEPLRHYAEVHLLLEPGEPGSGIVIAADCSEDQLDKNWQRLVLTHLYEKEQPGVLIGAPITDIRMTLVAGRAHQKHTEGGDFRQATYRAVRQGLMEAQSVLLEPYYSFRLIVPEAMTGRAMTDIERMCGTFEAPQTENGSCILCGKAPVATMQSYPLEVIAYTRGEGRLFCEVDGYAPCHNAEEVCEAAAYDPERDTDHPSSSVFCSHGAGHIVPWYEVKQQMHVESVLNENEEPDMQPQHVPHTASVEEEWIGTDEVDRILRRTYQANKKEKNAPRNGWNKKPKHASVMTYGEKASGSSQVKQAQLQSREEYLLVDGYNIIFAWEELNALAQENIDGARGRLLDIMCNYQGIRRCNLIVVFDAYRVQGHQTEVLDYHNIHVVYTKEAETADQYIEKFAHEHGRKYRVTVATSDGLEQIIIRGQGCALISAREFELDVKERIIRTMEEYEANKERGKVYLLDGKEDELRKQIED